MNEFRIGLEFLVKRSVSVSFELGFHAGLYCCAFFIYDILTLSAHSVLNLRFSLTIRLCEKMKN